MMFVNCRAVSKVPRSRLQHSGLGAAAVYQTTHGPLPLECPLRKDAPPGPAPAPYLPGVEPDSRSPQSEFNCRLLGILFLECSI